MTKEGKYRESYNCNWKRVLKLRDEEKTIDVSYTKITFKVDYRDLNNLLRERVNRIPLGR